MKRVVITAASLAVVVVVVAVLGWLLMDGLIGRPISTDLSRVGQGTPALVLAFESYSPAGMAAIDLINEVRDDYEPQVEFLIADLGTPEGSAFAARHGLPNGAAVLLDGAGESLGVYPVAGDAETLRHNLDRHLPESA